MRIKRVSKSFFAILITLCVIIVLNAGASAAETGTDTDEQPFFDKVLVAGTECQPERITDHIYKVTYYRPTDGAVQSIFNQLSTTLGVQFILDVPENTEIERIWTGRPETFDLTKEGALTETETYPGKVVFNMSAAKEGNVSGSHYYAMCYYVELDNGDLYTLIDDSIPASITGLTMPEFIALYNENESDYLGDEYQILNLSNPLEYSSTVITGTAVSGEAPLVLRAEVYNKDQSNKFSFGIAKSGVIWAENAENWVVVNGEVQPEFYTSYQEESTYSAPFALQKGLNIIEVYSNQGGFNNAITRGYEWFGETDSRNQYTCTTCSAVYLIDYSGETAEIPKAGNDASLNETLCKAFFTGTSKITQTMFTSDGDGGFLMSAPSAYKTNPTTVYFACTQAALVSVVTADPQASVEIIDNTADQNLVSGSRVGTLHAINLCNLEGENKDQFTIRVTSADGSVTKDYPVKVIFADSSVTSTVTLGDGATYDDGVTFNEDTLSYFVNYVDNAASATVTVTPPVGGSAMVNDTVYTEPVTVSAADDFFTVTITAADGVTTETYYYVTKLADGTVPYFRSDPDTKAQAMRLLSSYYKILNSYQYFTSYWNVFGAVAAGSGELDADGNPIPYDFDGKYVYDVSKHTNSQATDPAACILQIVMLGENPYNFDPDGDGPKEAINFVERLQGWSAGGPFANNVWYVMAAKAVGIDPVFTENLKANGDNQNYDTDIRSWIIAALNGLVEEQDMVRYIESLRTVQFVDGEYIGAFKGFRDSVNMYTMGCVLSAIASSGADPDVQFALVKDGVTYTPLDTVEAKLLDQVNTKDMIIGLGDIIYGSNVWARYQLTEDKYIGLITKAETLDISIDSMPTYGTTGYGEAYYDLYERVADALEATGDTSMRPNVTWGMPYQLFEDAVAALPETITESDYTALEEVIDMYEGMDEGNRKVVASTTMDKYHTAVIKALELKDKYNRAAEMYERIINLPNPTLISEDDLADVEAVRSLYNTMSSAQRAAIAWAGASIMDKLEAAEAALGDLSNRITVTFTLLGDYIHAADETEVHTLKDGNLMTWIPETSYTVSKDATAYDVFEGALTENGISWYNPTGNYIVSITNGDVLLAEKSNGEMSGWMYTINGEYPGPINEEKLENGDKIVVHYTDDYTKEDTGYINPDQPDNPDTIVIPASIREMYDATAKTLLDTTPGTGSTGGEWMIFGLARSNKTIPDAYKNAYLAAVQSHIDSNINASGQLCKEIAENVLRPTATENARIALALTALGENPANFDSRDLLSALQNTDWVTTQGNNSTAFAILAFDAADYDASNKDALIASLLQNQLDNGGWNITSGDADQDTTMMVVQALAPYYSADSSVKAAVDAALDYIKRQQDAGGGFGTTVEGNAQVIVALTALGIDPASEAWCSASGKSVIDALADYFVGDGFMHDGAQPKYNQMASEQAFYALVAYIRYLNGQPSLYDMSAADHWPEGGGQPVEGDGYTITALESNYGFISAPVSAAAGDLVSVNVQANYGYALDTLYMNGVVLTVDKTGWASFIMPEGNVVLFAVFTPSESQITDLEAAMNNLNVTRADERTYMLIRQIQTVYGALTAEERAGLADAYDNFKDEVEYFEDLLDDLIDDALDELEDYYDRLDRDNYSSENWKKIKEIRTKAKTELRKAAYEEQVEEILDKALEDMRNVKKGGKIEVTFRLIGDLPHQDGVNDHEEYVTWIETTEYELEAGSTVYDLFVMAIDDFDLNERGSSKNYVSTIQAPDVLGGYWLGEFDNGPNSGWMYTVNGVHPSYGLMDWELEDGDEVIWHYVDDYTLEERKSSSWYYYRWLEADDISPEEYVDDKIDEILTVGRHGEVSPDKLDVKDIGRNVTFKFVPDSGYTVEDVIVDGKSMGAISSYTYKNLQIGSRIEVVFSKVTEVYFADVSANDWFYDDVQYVVREGLFNGTGDTTFSPNLSMNRAMLVTVLYRLEGEPAVYGYSSFSDVSLNQWYTDAVIWATKNGIVQGYDNGLFGADDNITREQIATILYRYAQYKGYDTYSNNGLAQYSDRGQISSFALTAMKWANGYELITGRTSSTLAPQGAATRAEVAAILHRFMDYVVV